ncbi:MAG: DUF2786 domain-containing protein [Actinomycetota bacterium]|nr:DUF2786 domain-containing protein [Actinomycetota bacterium]
MRTYERTDRVAVAVLAGRLGEAGMLLARGGVTPMAVVHEVAEHGPERAGAAAGAALSRVLELLWQRGWLPSDVVAATSRGATSLIIDAIAEVCSRYPTARLHHRWRDQLVEVGAFVWWERGRAHLPQWAHREGLSPEEALVTVVELIAALVVLPQLPHLVPSPGSLEAGLPVDLVDRRVLVRVRGLLAKAESTSYPEEAEALSAKAQELMARYSFDQALTEQAAPREAAARRFWLEMPYQAPKAQLVDAVATTNRCRSVYYAKLGCVAVVGHETDLEIVDVLSASLQVQATRALLTAPSRSRAYRHSFLMAYAHRIRQRLETAGREAQAGDTRLLPVLAQRVRAVDVKFDAMFPGVRVRRSSVSDMAGWGDGVVAADRADLVLQRRRVAG